MSHLNYDRFPQVFHLCLPAAMGNTMTSFLCPNSTLFDQSIMQCNWWYYVNCETSARHYDANLHLALSYRRINAAHVPLTGVGNLKTVALLSHNTHEMLALRRIGEVATEGEKSTDASHNLVFQRRGEADSFRQPRKMEDEDDEEEKNDGDNKQDIIEKKKVETEDSHDNLKTSLRKVEKEQDTNEDEEVLQKMTKDEDGDEDMKEDSQKNKTREEVSTESKQEFLQTNKTAEEESSDESKITKNIVKKDVIEDKQNKSTTAEEDSAENTQEVRKTKKKKEESSDNKQTTRKRRTVDSRRHKPSYTSPLLSKLYKIKTYVA